MRRRGGGGEPSDKEASEDDSFEDVLLEEAGQEEELPEEEMVLEEESAPEGELQEEELQGEELQEEELEEEEIFEEEIQEEPEIKMQAEPRMSSLNEEHDQEDETEEDEEEEKPSRWTLALPSAILGWVTALLLGLSLAAGIMVPADWWVFKWYDINSSFRLTGLSGDWRVHSFGNVLVVKGTLTNTDNVTQAVPKIRISLLDQEHKELVSGTVIPGRVIDDQVLDESTEDSLRTMIQLQADAKKVKVERLWPGKELPFQFMFINPPEKASRFQIDFDNIHQTTMGTAGFKTLGGN
ncbi:MAG: DUF3426 domain-containing protein [Magnetococcales bacterium]|nr:DUF3426 domain-containing protein [Magnetococcales bacterium]